MSSQEPSWFCHECHAEMRPLMVPDPVCASCHGTFVEKMENPSDDPRHFAHDDSDFGDDIPPGMDTFLRSLLLQTLTERGMRQNPQASTRSTTGPSVTFEVRGPHGRRTINIGGSNTLRGAQNGGLEARPESPGAIPTMSAFLRSSPLRSSNPGDQDRPTIQEQLNAQYLMNLFSQHDFSFLGGRPEHGRMGDYVFNQEALDQVITQIMEHSNSHRPVPATDEIIEKLPREVLMEGSKMLQHDCAVCKEQFILGTEDPDEQIIVTLPCNHPFHMPCILPWLKSSGTCPVCRHALISQPDHHPPPRPGSDFNGGGPRRFNSGSDAGGSRGPEPGGLFHSIFGFGNNNINNNNDRSGSGLNEGGRRSNSDPMSSSSSRRNRHDNGYYDHNLPGAWSEDLD